MFAQDSRLARKLARVTVTDRLIAALTSVARRHGALIVQPPDDVTLEQLQQGLPVVQARIAQGTIMRVDLTHTAQEGLGTNESAGRCGAPAKVSPSAASTPRSNRHTLARAQTAP